MLASANGQRVTKTKLMYASFLSYAQLREYLALVVENGLLSFDSGSQTYQTTPKGLQFLTLARGLGEMIEHEGQVAAQ
jgi:predicted transcriptional regulator